MRFDWDQRKAAANLAKHGVSFDEAATVFGDALSLTYSDPDHSRLERRWITIGHSESGRTLVVAHSDEGEDVIRIINARRATSRERRFHEEG